MGVDVAGSPRPGGGGSRVVRFDAVLKLILVPSRNDLKELSPELWYSEEDYLEFRWVRHSVWASQTMHVLHVTTQVTAGHMDVVR